MKKILIVILIPLFLFITYCKGQNHTDENNLKQGHWIVLYKDIKRKTPGYKPDQVVEEGDYVDGKRVGVWKGFFPDGKTKHEITYKDGIPEGFARFYYKNGNIAEEGMWKINKWTGEYKYYSEQGELLQERDSL